MFVSVFVLVIPCVSAGSSGSVCLIMDLLLRLCCQQSAHTTICFLVLTHWLAANCTESQPVPSAAIRSQSSTEHQRHDTLLGDKVHFNHFNGYTLFERALCVLPLLHLNVTIFSYSLITACFQSQGKL